MARTSLWWSGVWLCAAAVVAMPWHPAPRRLVETNRLDETYRLPGEAVPLHYDINLTPLLQPSFTFEGTVNILIEAKVNSPTLTLHADAGLKVQSCSLDGTSLANPTIDAERQFLVFALGGQSLVAGKQYTLTCIFMGTLSDDNRGFYRASYYDNEEDQIKWLAGTQFGPNFARRVFPCFDEPSLRATFSLTIQHNQDVSVVSNMRPSTVSRPGSNNLVTTKFEKTPAMPTYTLAWLVSYLPAVVSQDQGFSTYARPAALGKATLSQTVAPQVLQYMREYTGVPYVLDKLDQIAVPGFSGATENWGLISYREALVLADAQSRSTSNLAATTAVARQVAHQWFGNLVTPSWWSDVWLSEGFATLFSYLNADQVQPEWKVLGKMPVLEAHAAFVEDGVTSSLPLSYEDVSTPAEILARFGRTAAAKGASVLRMIRDKITPATFQKGVQYYLEDRKASGVANVNQLWSAFNKAIVEDGTLGSSVDFNSLAASWTNQAGYPVVTFSRKASTANVEQARFYTTGTVASDSTIWHIPLSWRAEGDTSVRQVDSFASSSITINNVPAAAKWVLANVDQVGFYRVNYDRSNWEALSSALAQNVDALSEAERAMLVDDAFALARAGLVDYEVTLALCGFLASETAFAPWAAFQNNVDYLAVQLRAEDEDGAKVLDAWVQRLVHQRVEKLTFTSQPSESFEDKLSRGVVARLALEASDAAATSAATIAFNDWGLGTRLNADTARLSLCQGVRANNQLEPSAVFRELLERLKASADESEREDYIYALGCAPETEEFRLKSEVLKVALEGEGLSQREQTALWKSLVSNLEGLRLVQRYAVDNSIAILQKYGLNKLVTMISTVAPRISLQSDYNELQAFATGGGAVITGLAETLNAALEVARQNLEWRSKYYRAVVDALREESTTTIGIPTDPAVRTTATTATPFTLPPTSAATQPTLPTLAPASSTADPGLPTDPATRTTATTPTSFTLPPTRATTEPTLPTLPPTSSTAYTGPPTDPATRTTATTATYFTLPQTSATTPATLPTLAPTSPGTGTTRTPGTSATGTTSAYTGVYTDPATRTTATKPTFWTLPPASPTTPVTLPPISDSPTTPSPRPTNPTNPTRTAAPTNPTRTVAPTNSPSTAAPTNPPSTAAPTNPSSTTVPTPSTTEKSGSASMRSSCGIIILLWLVSRFV